jgi:hypothetical protein
MAMNICDTCDKKRKLQTIDVGWYDFLNVCGECEKYL